MEPFCNNSFWHESSVLREIFSEPYLCLEHTWLTWIPFAVVLLSAPLLVCSVRNWKGMYLKRTFLLIMRWVVSGLVAVSALVTCLLMVTVHHEAVPFNDIDFIAFVLNALAMIGIFCLVVFSTYKGVTTSGVIFISVALYALLGFFEFYGVARRIYYNMWCTVDMGYLIYYVLLLALLFLSCFADQRCSWDLPVMGTEVYASCPEKSVSFLNQWTYAYFDRTAWKGWRHGIQKENLWLLNSWDTVHELLQEWEKYWQCKSKRFMNIKRQKRLSSIGACRVSPVVMKGKQHAPSLLMSILGCFKWQILSAFIFKLITDVVEFLKPQILGKLIHYMESKDLSFSYGVFFSFLLLLIGIWNAFIGQKYFHIMFRVGMNIKSILMASVFEKSIRLSNKSRKDITAGEMTNLLSVDVQRIIEVCPYILMIFTAPTQVALAIVFLWQNLGPSVLAGLAAVLLLLPINFFLSKKQLQYQADQMIMKDARLKMMSEVLDGIKVVKLQSWELAFEQKVQETRKRELVVLRKAAIYGALGTFTWTLAPFLITVISFATYVLVDAEHVLTPEITFVSLSLFKILQFPISLMPIIVAYSIHAYVSMKRFESFLNVEEVDYSSVTRVDSAPYPVSFEKATFVWDAEDAKSPSLNGLEFKIPKGKCTAIIGRVGSGKSSLCSAILGEMEKQAGSVVVSGKLAYVPQEAWILNTTVRANILFFSPYQSNFYKRVVHACGLQSDIESMPLGDKTVIEEKGANLSGGQKQRLSLARAVYNDADIYIMDDPLSAVDSCVGRHIFDNVIGRKGLLNNKTRIFITNALTYLKDVDLIIIMDNGRVQKIGTPSELFAEEKSLKQFLQGDAPGSPRESDEGRKMSAEDGGFRGPMRGRTDSAAKKSSAGDTGDPTDIEDEVIGTGGINWRVYNMYLKALGIKNVIIIGILTAISGFFTVYSNLWLAEWSEDSRSSVNTSEHVSTFTRIGAYTGFGLGEAVFVLLSSLMLMIGMVSSSGRLHASLLRSLLRAPMSFFEITPFGRVLNRVGRDTDIADNVLPQYLKAWFDCVVDVLTTVIIIMINMGVYCITVLPFVLVYTLIQRFYIATSRQLQRMEAVTRSPIYSHFQEIIHGVSSIRTYNAEHHFRLKMERLINSNQMNYYPMIVSMRWISVRIELLGSLLIFIVAMFASYHRDSGSISAGMAGLAVTSALSITQLLNWVVEVASQVETNIVAVERIDDYIRIPPEAEWETAYKPPAEWPSKGHIEFKNYSAKYRPDLDLALRSVNFVANGGEKVGIVGRTGAGKSSITLALFRIIEPLEGCIVIDGIDVTKMGLHSLRSRLNIIPQEAVLFSGSVRMNVDPLGEKTDDEIWRAIDRAHLKSFVSSLPQQLEHNISEGGTNLSLGQRQLICLARALLHKSQILVLDEATAAVDLQTDDLIQQTIRECFADSTVLTIAHRLNTVMDSDRILVLRAGQVTENDSPQNLLNLVDGELHAMAKESKLL